MGTIFKNKTFSRLCPKIQCCGHVYISSGAPFFLLFKMNFIINSCFTFWLQSFERWSLNFKGKKLAFLIARNSCNLYVEMGKIKGTTKVKICLIFKSCDIWWSRLLYCLIFNVHSKLIQLISLVASFRVIAIGSIDQN